MAFINNFLNAGGAVTFLNVVLSDTIPVSPAEWRKALNAISTSHMLSAESGLHVNYSVKNASSIAAGILEEADPKRYDLILFATSSYRKRANRLFGNKIDDVIKGSKVETAVLSYFDDRPIAYKKILLPTSGYHHALKAADMAEVLAKRHDSDVTVLYVGSKNDDTTEVFRPITTMFNTSGIRHRALFRNGPVAETILDEAHKGYDLMMIGATERQMIFKYLLGSTADRLIKGSPCPVLMVKTTKD
jgi:nucleotide-binding universal stress UspA family protein